MASRMKQTVVGISTSSTASSADSVGTLLSVGGPDASVEDVDVTTFDSVAREHMQGFIEGGEIKFTMALTKAKQTTIIALVESTVTTKSIYIGFETDGNFVCQGYLNAYGIESGADKDMVKGSFGWKVSGLPVFSTA